MLTELNGTPIVYEGQTYDPETNEVGGSILSGNPKYYNGWNFDWQRGRELASAEQNDGTTNTTLTYAYDADGIRTSKTYTVETQHTVTFVADGTTVKTMTVADGYTLKTSDYPTVPAKSGYTGSWQKYTAAIHSNITVQATYSALAQYTVRFVADGVTVKTMTVYDGYVLKNSDYPAVPEKEGYSGAWSSYTSAIHENITISAAYLPNRLSQYTVTFKHFNKTVSILKVNDGQILRSKDYPTPPTGYGWSRNTNPIHANTTIRTTPGTGKHLVEFEGNHTLAKIMAVADGYKLKDSDYPAVPAKSGYTGTWTKYTDAIYEDITVTATYKKSETIKPPTRPTSVVASEDLPEPIEPQDVGEPDDTANASDATGNTAETQASHHASDATGNTAETQASHPGQALVSTQSVTHEYLTLSGKVVRETVKVNGSVTEILDFLYDESGRPFALNYSTNGGSSFITYYYILNLQGDVVKLVTSSGSAVATYEYDAWGNVLSKSGTMADKNPLRYRGYYYDTETGFYYLQSRYYDPANRRFVNADSYSSTGQGFVGTNMFAYCNNNPVVYADDTGSAPWWLLPFWGFIHMAVETDIANNHPRISTEEIICYPNKKKHGRADLCDTETGEVWEIKSSGPASLLAEAQLAEYCTGYVSSTKVNVIRGEECFFGVFTIGKFRVLYWTRDPGVILYTFDLVDSKKETALVPVPSPAPSPQKARESASHGLIIPIAGVPKFGGGWKSDDTTALAHCQ